MNKNIFFEIINDTSKLNNINISDLDEIIEEYPYFQIPYLLKTKLLYDSNSFKYDNFVKISAIYVNDRAKLFNFTHNKHQKNTEDKIIKEIHINKEEPTTHATNINETPTPVTKSENNNLNKQEIPENSEIKKSSKQTNEIKSSDSNIEPTKPISENIEKTKEKVSSKNTPKTLADEILEKLKTGRKQKNEESIADKILKKIEEAKKTPKEKTQQAGYLKKEEVSQTNTTNAKKETPEKNKNTDNTKKSQTEKKPKEKKEFDILKEIEAIDNSLPAFEQAFDINSAPKPKTEEKESEEMSFEEWLDFIDSKKTQTTSNKKNKQDSLIERFIKDTTPKKIKVKNDIDNNNIEKVIQKSTEEKDDLITETLANIYIKQKLYNKAIKAFTKLSLKYPEKSIYFANRIKELNKLIKK